MESNVELFKKTVCLVKVTFKNGWGFGTGTGFFVSNNGHILTAFHVIMGDILKNIRNKEKFLYSQGTNETDMLTKYHKAIIQKIEIKYYDGTVKEAFIKDFNFKYDIALLKLSGGQTQDDFLEVDLNPSLVYGTKVLFVGFQQSGDLKPEEAPFTINNGLISAFVKISIGGEKYEHIQINSTNLYGNSGGPLLIDGTNKVIGIINGNMVFGNVPVSVAYSTSLKLIKQNTTLLNSLNPR